jgi:CHAT domain-containing protein/Tfp pilus assembly protein PilF
MTVGVLLAGLWGVAAGWAAEPTPEQQRLRLKAREVNQELGKLYQEGNYKEAGKRAEELLRICEAAYPRDQYPQGHSDLSGSLNNLGFLLFKQGEYDKALPYLQRALEMEQELHPKARFPKGHLDLAFCLDNLGQLLEAQGEYGKALAYSQRALEMREALYPKEQFPKGHPDLATSLSCLGSLLQAQREYVQALSHYQRALEMREALYPKEQFPKGHPDLATSLSSLGTLLWDQGEYAKALPYDQRALEMNEALYSKDKFPQGHPHLATSLNNLGSVLQNQGELAKALPYFQRALEMREMLYPRDRYPQGHPDLANSLHGLGLTLEMQGELSKALPYSQRALEMNETLYPRDKYPAGHRDLVLCLHCRVALLTKQGELAKALPFCLRALEMNEALYPKERYPRGHPHLATSLNNLAMVLTRQGELSRALPYSQRALEMTETLYPRGRFPKGHPRLAFCLSSLGSLLEDQGEYPRALSYNQSAVEMYERLYPKGHPELSRSLAQLGGVLYWQGEHARALPFLQRALEMEQELIATFLSSASEAESLNRLAELPFTRDGYLSVSRHLPQAQEAVYGSLWLYKAALTHVLETRRQALLLSADPACRDLSQQLTQTRRELARMLLAPPDRFPDQARRTQRLTDRKEELERQLASQLPAFAELQARNRLTPRDLMSRLPEGTVLVDLVRYFHLERDPKKPGLAGETWTASYLAFVLAKGQPLRRVDLGPAEPIEQALLAWRQEIMAWRPGHSADAGRLHATALRKLLWEPIARCFPPGTETVMLAPDGPLAFLPWSALPGPQPGTVLLEQYALAVVPSARFILERLLGKPGTAKPAEGLLLAVGGVRYDEDPKAVATRKDELPPLRAAERGDQRLHWPELPGSSRELDQVLALKGKRAGRQRRDTEASVDQLLLDLPEARWAHLATHAFFADARFRTVLQLDEREMKKGYRGERVGLAARNPLVLSGLVLAGANRKLQAGQDDGILTAEAIAGLALDRLELAVLSACDTGLGDTGDFRNRRGEMVFGRAGGEGVFGLQRAFHVAGARNVVASLWKVNDQATAALMALFYHKLWQEQQTPLQALCQAQLHVYRHPEAIPVLAGKRGPDFDREVKRPTEPKPQPQAKPGDRAAVPLWAGFVLSGLGR